MGENSQYVFGHSEADHVVSRPVPRRRSGRDASLWRTPPASAPSQASFFLPSRDRSPLLLDITREAPGFRPRISRYGNSDDRRSRGGSAREKHERFSPSVLPAWLAPGRSLSSGLRRRHGRRAFSPSATYGNGQALDSRCSPPGDWPSRYALVTLGELRWPLRGQWDARRSRRRGS